MRFAQNDRLVLTPGNFDGDLDESADQRHSQALGSGGRVWTDGEFFPICAKDACCRRFKTRPRAGAYSDFTT